MDREELAYSMWFQKINSIGARTMFHLKEVFGSMQEAYAGEERVLRQILNSRQYSAFKAAKYALAPMEYLERVERMGIRYVSFDDEIFPDKLKTIPDPPFGLFVKGALPDSTKPAVAMIGARACSEYGKAVAREFAKELAGYDIQIISGMARGIDSISQESCLKAGGRTFAVLGNGVDICYPEELGELYEGISVSGGLLSTYAPGMPPVSANFPPRNRIISGLADVLLVVEARKKSGTLITVDMALEQGKEVGIIPGRITDALSQGCHDLIKQGATVIVDVEQLLQLLKDTFEIQCLGRYNQELVGIHMECREQLTKELRGVYEILEKEPYEPMEPEVIYKKWLEQGGEGDFQSLMQNLMELELMDLCKSYKNRFSIH